MSVWFTTQRGLETAHVESFITVITEEQGGIITRVPDRVMVINSIITRVPDRVMVIYTVITRVPDRVMADGY